MSLLNQLMSQKPVSDQVVDKAKEELHKAVSAEFFGVNAPEFSDEAENASFFEKVESEIDPKSDMEVMFEAQESSKATITLPIHDDGLDDSEEELTIDHMPTPLFTDTEEIESAESVFAEVAVEETPSVSDVNEEDLPWNKKPFDATYFNFKGRTVNALERAELKCFDDIKGYAYSELLDIKGFGRNALSEILEMLEAEGVQDWLLKRRRKGVETSANPVVHTPSVSDVEVVVPPQEPPPQAPQEFVSQVVEEEESQQSKAQAPQESVTFSPEDVIEEDDEVITEASSPARSFRVLVVGGATSLNEKAKVSTLEAAYGEAIEGICKASNAPSIALIEYGKGWAALATTIRQMGWPEDVDVLCVSKSFLSRSEVLFELRSHADVVIEG